MRTQALSAAADSHGANSAAAVRVRLSRLASQRAAGRLAEAEIAAWQCVDGAKGQHDVLLLCLTARAETAIAAGSDRLAAELSAKAVLEAETHWTRDGGTLVQASALQARAQAAVGDADAVIRLYDRIHGLTPDQGISRAWTDFAEGRLLTQAGETIIGPEMLSLALRQGKQLHNPHLAVAATAALAEQLEQTGKGQEAVALWEATLPLLSDDTPALRVTVLEGLGTAAAGMAQHHDAARLFGQAAALAGTAIGPGSPTYGRVVLAWSEALAQSGEPDKAEDALRLLDGDPSPAMRRLRTIGMMQLALVSNDSAAAVMLARSTMEQARGAFGSDSVGTAYARLDLDRDLAGDQQACGPGGYGGRLAGHPGPEPAGTRPSRRPGCAASWRRIPAGWTTRRSPIYGPNCWRPRSRDPTAWRRRRNAPIAPGCGCWPAKPMRPTSCIARPWTWPRRTGTGGTRSGAASPRARQRRRNVSATSRAPFACAATPTDWASRPPRG